MAQRSTRARRALAQLPESDPSLAALSLWCRIVDGGARTRTAAETIFIGEDLSRLPLREQVGLLGHHILHIALRHERRMSVMAQRWGGAFQAKTYNLAADAIVNECLEQAGHALPRPSATLSTLLTDVLRQPQPNALSEWDVERLYLTLAAQDQDGRTRQAAYSEAAEFTEDVEAKTSASLSQEDADWRGHLARALAATGSAGRGVGPVLSTIRDLPRVTTPWEVHLRRIIAKAVREDPRITYSKPQRNWLALDAEARRRDGPQPAFQPGYRRNAQRARIVVGVDTSGSITDQMLALFAAEVIGVARRSAAEVHLLAFDETVHTQAKLSSADSGAMLSQLKMRRDGGTAYMDLIARATALEPSLIIALTDLDGVFGPPPTCDILWATPLASPPQPPFGRVLALSC